MARARALLEPHLQLADRVLVIGAGGWFGSVVLDLIGEVIPRDNVLCLAREPRLHQVGDRMWELHSWDENFVREFSPTVVVNLAFLTRGYAATMNARVYETANTELTRRFMAAAAMPAVRMALTVSSGAAITERTHPYGRLKWAEEQAALAAPVPGRSMVVARAYSVSGAHLRHPADFAFSSFVQQAAEGAITVLAERPTHRRYCDIGEYLAVCLSRGLDGFSGVIESGGEIIEMRELAQLVANATSPAVAVHQTEHTSDEPSVYASDDSEWLAHCEALGFAPSSLADQVATAVRRNRREQPGPR